MNIINIKPLKKLSVSRSLFANMEHSLTGSTNFERSVRLAAILAPVLRDSNANERHLSTINAQETSVQEKIIAIIMLGFSDNRPALPTLKKICLEGSGSLRMAAAIAISQMRDGHNNDLLSDILLSVFKPSDSPEVKKTLLKALHQLLEVRLS